MDMVAWFAVLTGVLLRWTISLHGYSGQGNPPMYGDFEAQRHWMEITVNLPPKEWYENTPRNELQYWGLDYPPLTAYHSWFCGKIASWINPEWISLGKSRGLENPDHKTFMRATALVSDLIIFFTAVFAYWRMRINLPRDQVVCSWLTLASPCFILVDHGHFQYNSVCLGFVMWTIVLLSKSRYYLASIAFCAALNFKQISLYFALPIFVFLLAQCLRPRVNTALFVGLAATVAATFTLLWAPFLMAGPSTVLQVVRRLFPFERGLFEDKVANIWCVSSVVIKLKQLYSAQLLARVAAVVTLLAQLPSLLMLFKQPNIKQLQYSLICSSLAFYLFSYQVHEKSILFPLLAFQTLLVDRTFALLWFANISTFSLFPLMLKDNLLLPYVALTVIYNVLFYKMFLENGLRISKFVQLCFVVSTLGGVALNVSQLMIAPPARYPDLHVMLNCAYSFAHFGLFFLYVNLVQWSESEMYKVVRQRKLR